MEKLYSIQEVALKLNLSDKTLRRWEEAGRFTPSRTLGNQRRYSLEDLQILDAIKHGTINKQSDLLSISQASGVCGVSPATIMRWENEGKIHPLITSGNTYYPRTKLIEKMDELKKTYVEPAPTESDLSPGTVPKRNPWLQAKEGPAAAGGTVPNGIQKLTVPVGTQLTPLLTNALITLLLILSYHFFFNVNSAPVSPQPVASPSSGSVQGVTAPDPRLDILEQKLADHLSAEMLKDAAPLPVTTINLDNTSIYSGKLTLAKGQDRLTYTNDQITPQTTVTATFTSDFSPAKKYWITPIQGSFTLATDFPVGQDAGISYTFLTPTSTPSATPN